VFEGFTPGWGALMKNTFLSLCFPTANNLHIFGNECDFYKIPWYASPSFNMRMFLWLNLQRVRPNYTSSVIRHGTFRRPSTAPSAVIRCSIIQIFVRQLSPSPSRPACRIAGGKVGLYFIFVPASGKSDGRRVGEGATDESRRHRQAWMNFSWFKHF